mmetsp:Transcript_8640/g.17509  ORF Transcript_8640/g.17509 Transcript_8640/m.17509 type:complete len:204 (+) Transcript_8640:4081-4692(+)
MNKLLQEFDSDNFLFRVQSINVSHSFFEDSASFAFGVLIPIVLIDSRQFFVLIIRIIQDCSHCIRSWSPILMYTQNMISNLPVSLRGCHVQYDKKKIEARKERVWQGNILMGLLASIVGSVKGISSSDDRAAGIQRRMNPRLCNGHRLLLHDFVNCDTILIAHLVKFIDADHTPVGQNHCTSLQLSLSGILISRHCRRQPDTG